MWLWLNEHSQTNLELFNVESPPFGQPIDCILVRGQWWCESNRMFDTHRREASIGTYQSFRKDLKAGGRRKPVASMWVLWELRAAYWGRRAGRSLFSAVSCGFCNQFLGIWFAFFLVHVVFVLCVYVTLALVNICFVLHNFGLCRLVQVQNILIHDILMLFLYLYGLESFVTYAPVHRNNTSSQVLAIHECTSRFLRAIFDHHLGHLYYVFAFHAPQVSIDLVFLFIY